MNRHEELFSIVPEESRGLVDRLIYDMVFLEVRLTELKQLPFIQVNPKNPMQQRNTPAAKLYKELLQQYANCVKLIETILYRDKRLEDEDAEDSPLRKWFKGIESR